MHPLPSGRDPNVYIRGPYQFRPMRWWFVALRQRSIPCQANWKSRLSAVHTDYRFPERNSNGWSNTDLSWVPTTYFMGAQITESENHPSWLLRDKRRFQGDLGGPFLSQKWWVEFNSSPTRRVSGTVLSEPEVDFPAGRVLDQQGYVGPVLPLSPNYISWPSWRRSSDSSLDALGTTAISRCSPSNASVDLAVTIGELLREGIPSAIGATLKNLRDLPNRQRRQALGKEYLNLEFGWKPLVDDLMKFCFTIINAGAIFDQYQRDSQGVVRRGYDFPVVKETDIVTVLDGASPWINPSSGGLYNYSKTNMGQVLRTYEYEARRWFRGAFTYYVPPADGLRNSMARAVIQARKVYGLSLTPDTLWNLSPWSWMVDWFTNTGDILSNWTDWAIDNQVLLYGYMMEHSFSKYTYTFAGETGFSSHSGAPSSISTCTEYKIRRKATPYGFGLELDDLSSRQQAIVAALGLSRSR